MVIKSASARFNVWTTREEVCVDVFEFVLFVFRNMNVWFVCVCDVIDMMNLEFFFGIVW